MCYVLKAMSKKYQISCIALLLLAVAVQAVPWGPDSFPDPKRDVNLCGRKGKSSNICDPDGILSIEGADRVEGIIKDIWEGVDPYRKAPCGDQAIVGFQASPHSVATLFRFSDFYASLYIRTFYLSPYSVFFPQVAVAVMRNMYIKTGESPGDAAHRIAKALHAKWGVGLAACDNGVLLLLAVDDRQVYISTGVGAEAALSSNDLISVVSAMKPKLREKKYDEAVAQAVVDIGLGLAGRSISGEWEIFPVLFFLGVIGTMIFSCVKSMRARRQYRECKTALQRVKDEQEKLRTKEWSKPRTCPICMDEFSVNPETIPEPSAPPIQESTVHEHSDDPSAPLLASESGNGLHRLSNEEDGEASTSINASASPSSSGLRRRNSGKMEGAENGLHGGDSKTSKAGEDTGVVVRTPITLRCGHTFCEPCLETWLDRAVTCPICRDRIDGGDGADRPPVQHQSQVGRRYLTDDLLSAELMFRLMRLRDRYPGYITPNLMDTWRDEATTTGTFNYEQAREFQLNDPAVQAQQASHGSSGNSMSFGGGRGGGGGAGGSW